MIGWLKRCWSKRWTLRGARREVLQALADRPGSTGGEVWTITGLSSGSVYAVLIVAEERGAVASEWGLAARPGGPRPRRYRLTEQGQQELKQLQEVH